MLYLMGLLGVIREGSGYCIEKINTRHFLKKALVVIPLYGTGQSTKTDEFSEKVQKGS